MTPRRTLPQQGYFLSALTGGLLLLSVAYVPVSSGSVLADLSEIAIPLGVVFGLSVCSARSVRGDYGSDRVKRMAACGWVGAIVASFGVWWLAWQFQFRRGMAAGALFDEALTVVSVGSGVGVLVGIYVLDDDDAAGRTDRDNLASEAVWTNDPDPNPILSAVTAQIAELDGVDPLELSPLYDHVNPDAFAELREQSASQWQVLFYTDDYEVRVSSHGMVTIYRIDDPDERRKTVVSRGEKR